MTDDTPGPGHNSVGGIAGDRLKSFIERVERLNEERADLSADIREVLAEAKSSGFDTKAIRKIIALRKLDPSERQAQAYLLEVYCRALDMDLLS